MKKIKYILKTISRFFSGEDLTGQAYVLNVILTGLLLLSLTALLQWIVMGLILQNDIPNDRNIWPIIFFVFLFLVLIKLSKVGYSKISAFILIFLLLLATFQTSYTWGVNLPQAVATYALIIFMSGILLGPTRAVLTMLTISLVLFLLFHFQDTGVLMVNTSWKQVAVTPTDVIVLNTTYLIIAIISWLSGKEIIKSVRKAKKSEKEALDLADKLKKQNENLELVVEARTKELRENQLKQLMHLNNFAAFGKISAELLHDIKNPLTIISLNLDSLKQASKPSEDKKKLFSELINRSLLASKTVESIIRSSQKQFPCESDKELFSLVKEVKNTLLLTKHRADRLKIKLSFVYKEKIKLKGFPTKLSRVITNLIINSIDSFENIKRNKKKIEISIIKEINNIQIIIKDNGCGIKNELQNNIFKPMVSTKNINDHAGLGLYCSQKTIQDFFKGEISFKSKEGVGSEFIIKIPSKIK